MIAGRLRQKLASAMMIVRPSALIWIAVVDRPEISLPVDGDTEHGVEQLGLLASPRIGNGRAVRELEQLVAFGSCLGVHSEKDASGRADGNVANRQRVRQNLLECFLLQDRRARQIGVRLSTTISNPRGGGCRNQHNQQQQQYVFHRSWSKLGFGFRAAILPD